MRDSDTVRVLWLSVGVIRLLDSVADEAPVARAVQDFVCDPPVRVVEPDKETLGVRVGAFDDDLEFVSTSEEERVKC